MKVTVDIDCTPEEARRFMGLPDISPVHDAYVEKMRGFVTDGVSLEHMTELMKSWGPMSDAGVALWKQMFDQMSGKK